MQRVARVNLFFLLFTALVLMLNVEVSAQKKKKKDKKEAKEAPSVVVTDEDKRKAELYHVEAEKYYILDDFAKSFVLYQQSLEVDPGNATAYYRIAQILVRRNEFDKAMYNAQRAVKLDEKNKYFYLLLADIYSKKSDFKSAAETYEAMIRKCEKVDEYLFELAALYIYQEDYSMALNIYERIEEKFGINEQVIAQKQKLYLKQSNLDLAIAEGQKLIDAFPGEPRYVIMLAEILISNNQSERAVPYLEDLVRRDPESARALLMLADHYRKSGDAKKSNEYLNQAFGISNLDIQPKIQVLAGFIQKLPNSDIEAMALDLGEKIKIAHPDDPRSFEINGDLNMRLGNDLLALDNYKKALDLGASNFSTWQNVLQVQIKLEKYEEAISDGEQALELFPNQAGICWFLGTAYLASKAYDSAVEILEQGKKLSGSNEELKSFFNAQLGDAYNNIEEYKKSDESYEAALSFDPENDHVLNNYSYFLSLRKENLDLAKKMSTKLVLRNPDNSTYLDTHAWVLYMRGEYKEAKIYIEKALKGSDISGTIIEHYGDILFKLGEVDLAVKQWQKAKGMDESSELIDKKIADRKLYE
ncbi:MAG: tetratricopeptide repeat protein [Cytophagales bacterium]|nr:tetratricopeptide repeat protein [Cytophagales bacterium]